MGIALIVERRGEKLPRITLDEWKALVAAHSALQLRDNPYIAVNPVTREKISIPVGEADSEVLVDGQWLPFLRFRRGVLVTEYRDEFEALGNPIRQEIARVAKSLDAVICTDLGDDILEW